MGLLRLFLALAVLNDHGKNLLGFPLLLSDLAVQAFFIISGFYMALVLNEKYLPGQSTYWEFITNRLLRLFPAYLVMLTLTLLVFTIGWYYGIGNKMFYFWSRDWAQIDWSAKAFMVLSHLFIVGQDAYFFLGQNSGSLYFDSAFHTHENKFYQYLAIPQAWSLSLELYFYFLAPFLVRRPVRTIALIIAASLAIRLFLSIWMGWKNDPWAYRFFPSELTLFLCGALAYRIYRVLQTGKMGGYHWAALGMLGLTVWIALLGSRNLDEPKIWPHTAVVVAIAMILPFVFQRTKHSKIDGFIGELSYPIYLSHVLVIWLFMMLRVPLGVGFSAGVLSVTLLLSMCLYWYVDRKVDQFRHRKFDSSHHQ